LKLQPENVSITPAVTGAEDFSYYQEKIPGLYFFSWWCPKANQYRRPRRITPDFTSMKAVFC
jgi:metal-dependent amidase/aminoacylase/carboxypeptidase family protein